MVAVLNNVASVSALALELLLLPPLLRWTLCAPDVNALGGTGTLEALIDSLENFLRDDRWSCVSGSNSVVEIQILLVGCARSDVECSDLTEFE